MEDTHGENTEARKPRGQDVLILIIMEDTHGVLEQANERIVLQRS